MLARRYARSSPNPKERSSWLRIASMKLSSNLLNSSSDSIVGRYFITPAKRSPPKRASFLGELTGSGSRDLCWAAETARALPYDPGIQPRASANVPAKFDRQAEARSLVLTVPPHLAKIATKQARGLPDHYTHLHRKWQQAEPDRRADAVELLGANRRLRSAIGPKRPSAATTVFGTVFDAFP